MTAHNQIVFGLLLTCGAAWAQTAQINGTVKDSSGLPIPVATIKATQTATGAVRTTTSGPGGDYVLPNLPIGPYSLEVSKDGFSKYAQTGIVLQVDSNPTVDIPLQVGAVSEQVTVEAAAAQVETRTTAVGQVVGNQQVVEMPLNGRNPIELVLLAGLASSPGSGALNTIGRNYPTVVVSVAGGLGNGVSYQLDGTIFQDPYNNLNLPMPFPDALQEFKVETSALPAQYGYHSAAIVNAATKAGTNELHGDLFDFLRNGDLNARDFFAINRDNLKRNQYGGTAGGPIRKNKLFFFGGFQRTSQRSAPSGLTAFIPTAATLTGDFTTITSAACQSNGKPITLAASQGFVNNKISPALFNPVALRIVNTLIPTSDPCGRELYGQIANLDENLFMARIDYQQSEKNSVFGRFVLGNLTSSSTYDGKNPLSILSFANHNRDYQLALGDTYVVTTNLINSVRVSASRENVVKVPDPYKSLTDFGANITSDGTPTTTLTVTGGGSFSIAGSQVSQSHDGPNPSITDDISWVKGDHQFGFGGNLYFQGMNYRSNRNAVGIAAFNGSVTGLGIADFLLGDAVSFTQGTVYGFYQRQYYMSLYAQDSWKISRRLTLNYGVRWEPFTSVYSKYGQIHHFDPDLFAQNVHSTLFSNAPAG